jgi:hypothetical protein
MGEIRTSNEVLVGNVEGKSALGRRRRRWNKKVLLFEVDDGLFYVS